jgi:DUF1680 family protein
MKSWKAGLCGMVAVGLASTAALNAFAGSSPSAPAAPVLAVQQFDLQDVRLQDGPFKSAMELDQKYLLQLEPDRLLSGFRSEAGLVPKAAKYGGWESRGVAGHTLGHYLSACSEMYASTGDTRFLDRVNYIVDELATCQDANGDGYVAAIPDGKKIFHEISQGDIRTNGSLNGGWVPWYTLHKTLAGLRDACQIAGNQKAKTVLLRLCDWVDKTTANLSDQQMQKMLSIEQGGLVEVFSDVFGITGDQKYLTLSRRFTHHAVIDPLAAGVDKLSGLHDNTQIPKIIGSARRYELTGDPADQKVASFFWDTVTEHHSYVMGGHSEWEHFGPPDKLAARLGVATAETCNTYNLLKLTRHLFTWDPKSSYEDYFERALYNHILASQDPKTGMFTYFVPLKPGHFRTYSTPFDSMWCCVGTGMENHALYPGEIYAHDDAGLWVNLFIASTVNWKSHATVIEQQTAFPQQQGTRLTIKSSGGEKFTLHVRRPVWAGPGARLTVNGVDVASDADEKGYMVVDRVWKAGDVVDVTLPMSLHTEALADDPSQQAILFGPILLAGRMGRQGMTGDMPYATGELQYAKVPTPPVPVLVTDGRPVTDWVKPVDGQPLTFQTVGVGRPADVQLVPFYQLGLERYSIYWKTMTAEQFALKHAAEEAEQDRQHQLDARTFDQLRPGEQQSDQDHAAAGNLSGTGSAEDHHYRDAAPGGWFAYDLAIKPDQPVDLICTYWGGEHLSRLFDISVDGEKIATQALHMDHPGEYFDVTYSIPQMLTAGKTKITVKFDGNHGQMAGGLFGCRTLQHAEQK